MNSIVNYRRGLVLILAFGLFFGVAEIQAKSGARLIVQRAPNFGTDLIVHLSIDGKRVADIPRDQHYEGSLSGGTHTLTVVAMPNAERLRPTTTRITLHSGHTYVYTATWEADRGVVLRRSHESTDTTKVSTTKH